MSPEVVVVEAEGVDRSGPDEVTGVRAWASYNDEATWRPVASVAPRPDGTWEVVVQHPPVGSTNGYVGLRIEASDGAGNRTRRTIVRAYGLRAAAVAAAAGECRPGKLT